MIKYVNFLEKPDTQLGAFRLPIAINYQLNSVNIPAITGDSDDGGAGIGKR